MERAAKLLIIDQFVDVRSDGFNGYQGTEPEHDDAVVDRGVGVGELF